MTANRFFDLKNPVTTRKKTCSFSSPKELFEMSAIATLKHAKTITGTVYSYPVQTVASFKTALSLDRAIPSEVIQLFDDEKQVDDTHSIKQWLLPFLGDIDWDSLSRNTSPEAIRMLEANLDMVNWDRLLKNPSAIHIIEANPERVDWMFLPENPSAIHLIEAYLDRMGEMNWASWMSLSSNPNAIHILEANLDKVDWSRLSENPSAIRILEANLAKVDWYRLSSNPNAIHLLEANPEKVNWAKLSQNPNAIHLLEANLDKAGWGYLSQNSNAIPILEANLQRVSWRGLSINPNGLHLFKQLSPSNIAQYDAEGWEAGGYNTEDDVEPIVYRHFENLWSNPAIFYTPYEL